MQIQKKLISCLAGSLAFLFSLHGYAAETKLAGTVLTEEQSRLLGGYPATAPADFNFSPIQNDSLSIKPSTIPLLSFSLSATTNNMKGNAVEFDAKYKTWAINNRFDGLHYRTMETSITVESPLRKALDFSQSIREKVESACAEKMLDRLLVDGALVFNLHW